MPKWEWTEQGCYAELVRRLGTVSEDWWRKVWQRRAERWPGLGPMLRRTESIAAATHGNLLELYKGAFQTHIGRFLPDGMLTAEMVENNVGPLWDKDAKCWSKDKTQKLSRFLADFSIQIMYDSTLTNPVWLPGGVNHVVYKNHGAEWAGRITDAVRAHNGAYITLSANPLDVLDSSNFANWTSCHKWWCFKAGALTTENERAAGNFCYVLSPTALIAISHDKDYPQTTKCWRQLVFVHDDGQQAACSREYGVAMSDVRHELLRKMIAELLTGQENPPWQWHQACADIGFGQKSECGGVYGDTPKGMVRVGEDRKRKLGFIHTSPKVECPKCNKQRVEPCFKDVRCGECGGCDPVPKLYKCQDCPAEQAASSPSKLQLVGWLWVTGASCVCPACTTKYSACGNCGGRLLKSSLETVLYINDAGTRRDQQWCIACCGEWARNKRHARCAGCNKWTPSQDQVRWNGQPFHKTCVPAEGRQEVEVNEEARQLNKLRERLVAAGNWEPT